MKSLFGEAAFSEINDRIDNLSANSEKLWGKMSVGQMLSHCQEPLKVALGKGKIKKQFFPLAFLFKKSLYNDKPWKRNLPTASSFRVLEDKDFATEKVVLKKLIAEFHTKKNQTLWEPHPIFGKFSAEQWGKMQYKHLDHHLQQFGV
ncbi:MAG: hypothetical protein CL524_08185 [Aequorivita sp.]|nr:hypothetical protein [Aequorivita sp.]MBF31023.1 hypothetical protein [Aequorivita sp.]|tara:strand:+ start:55164 stop:55604 length:441 start_codon:yes stop_codon:yes gene_type:complete